MASIRLRSDYDPAGVRLLAKQAGDADQARRLLAIAAVYEGMSREDAARLAGMDRQTLRDWVHRFNDEGPDGLVNRAAPATRDASRPPRRPSWRRSSRAVRHRPGCVIWRGGAASTSRR